MVRNRNNRGMELAIFYLIRFLLEFGITRLPLISLALVASQILLFFGMGPDLIISENYQDVVISPYHVFEKKQWYRLFFGQMEHANDFHLYHNIMSLCWKGYYIERTVGFKKFLAMMITFITACGLGIVYSHYTVYLLTGSESYYHTGVLGFSSVLFALKIILTSYNPAASMATGWALIGINTGAWLELLLASFINPNSSFLGHLIGILIGYEYVYGKVLKSIVNSLEALISIGLTLSGLDEVVEETAENWNDRDDGRVNPNAGNMGMGGMGMGMGGLGMGMGGMGMGGRYGMGRRRTPFGRY